MITVRGVADLYDDLDAVYRAIFGEHLHHGLWRDGVGTAAEAGERMVSCIAGHLGLSRGERLLDVGCGYGRMAAELAERAGAEAVGITISRRQWEQAVPEVEVRHGDWLGHSYKPGSFDALIAVESLEHMDDPRRAVGEIMRVLRPGGRVVLGCWLRADDISGIERRLLIAPIRRDGGLAGMSDEKSLRIWMDEAGLELREVDELSDEVVGTWSNCLATGLRLGFTDRKVRQALFSRPIRALRLVLTAFRIVFAYRTGALRYLVVTGVRVK